MAASLILKMLLYQNVTVKVLFSWAPACSGASLSYCYSSSAVVRITISLSSHPSKVMLKVIQNRTKTTMRSSTW